MTPERGGIAAVAAAVAGTVRGVPATSRRPPRCQRAWPLRISAASNSATCAGATAVRWSCPLPRQRAAARTSSPAAASAAMRRGVVGVTLPLRSPISRVVTKHASAPSPGASSNTVREGSAGRASAALTRVSRKLCCSARRSAGKRSSAAKAAAAACAQPAAPQLQRLSKATRRPDAAGRRRTVQRPAGASTSAAMASPSSRTCTAPASTRLRPRISAAASKLRPRSCDENGEGISDGEGMGGRRTLGGSGGGTAGGGGGAEGNRTPDLLIANEALSQLSYSPIPRRPGP